VQFYITARCNLTCEQCNIIYANSDVRECSLEDIEAIAEHLRRIGVAIVLLTGGEPFVRKDLPEIVRAFARRGIHVRMQTNGLASDEALARCIANGGRDISISLDSLHPDRQDAINGEFPGSWKRALQTISRVTTLFPKKNSFASLGCVLSARNLKEVPDVIRFGTRIGWYTSLVPIHVTPKHKPMNFRTYDSRLSFQPEHFAEVDRLMETIKTMRREGYLLYDSDEYLDDIKRFVRQDPIQWRRKNGQVCDSPTLYLAILPNGHMAVCCDYRVPGEGIPVQAKEFPAAYHSRAFRERVHQITRACEGCMFGSYPEMTISARYLSAFRDRAHVFLSGHAPRPWPLSFDQLETIAQEIRTQSHA